VSDRSKSTVYLVSAAEAKRWLNRIEGELTLADEPKPALRPGRRFVPYPAYDPQTGRSGETSSLEKGKEVFARRLRRLFPGSLAISAQ